MQTKRYQLRRCTDYRRRNVYLLSAVQPAALSIQTAMSRVWRNYLGRQLPPARQEQKLVLLTLLPV